MSFHIFIYAHFQSAYQDFKSVIRDINWHDRTGTLKNGKPFKFIDVGRPELLAGIVVSGYVTQRLAMQHRGYRDFLILLRSRLQ